MRSSKRAIKPNSKYVDEIMDPVKPVKQSAKTTEVRVVKVPVITSKFVAAALPCVKCRRECKNDGGSLRCTECDEWIHRVCSQLDQGVYDAFKDDKFYCIGCAKINGKFDLKKALARLAFSKMTFTTLTPTCTCSMKFWVLACCVL